MATITAVKPASLDGLAWIKLNLDTDGKISQTQNHTACWDATVEQAVSLTMPVYTEAGNLSRTLRDVVTVTRNNRRSDTAELTPQAANDLVKMVGNCKYATERDPLNKSILIIRILED